MKKKSEGKKDILNQIEEQMDKIEYGSVTVVIHGGEVVQLDISEKIRVAN